MAGGRRIGGGGGIPALIARRRLFAAAAVLALLFAIDAAVVTTGLTQGLDRAALERLRVPGDPQGLVLPHWTLTLAIVATTVGGGTVRMPVAVAGAVWLLWRGQRREAALFAAGVASAAIAMPLIKAGFHRARPDAIWQLVRETRPSFPSGHAMGAAATYPMLGLLLGGRTWLWIGIAAALAIGCSRVFLGVHWASDVIGGWLIGGAWACATIGWLAGQGRVGR